MKIVVDSHTHTVASGHAYSTVQEMAREAPNNGIKMFAITDHGPAMLGGPSLYHFGNLKVIPSELYDVRIIKGVEANIIDFDGKIDMPEEYLKRLDFAVAGFHEICIKPATVEEHTNAIINVLKNPYIDAVAHPGNPQFQVDVEKVVKAAKENNKCLEINNHSFIIRTGSEKNCRDFVLMCKEYGVKVVCGSDAHISFSVGNFGKVLSLFDELKMPEELVLNTSVEKFEQYLREKKK
ncbi:MAG: phosphatase [Clostridia bacterium]|nr:phosphatase [Clostridia bacterium]